MSASQIGDYGEQGDFANDGQLEDALSGLGLDEPGAAGAPPAQPGAVDDTAPIPGGGKLLEEPSARRLFKAIDGIVLRVERVAKNRDERKKHWERVRGGVPFSFLEKNEDRSIYRATLPPGVDDVGGQPVPNKMDDLCNKIISQLLSDDYLPDPKPDGDADSDRGAADLAKKFLRADGMASGTDDRALLRDALNMNITAASAGALVWVDPTAGGWRPKQVQAHPRAQDASKPLYAPRLDANGMPVVTEQGPIMEKAATPVLRYVAEAGGQLVFTENAAEAVRQWLPKHRRKLLNVNQMRTVPQSASVFDADSIVLLMYDTLGEAKKRFQVLRTLPSEQVKSLMAWKPRRWKSIVPEAHRAKDAEGGGGVTDDQLIFWYEHYCRVSPDYQDGACICVNGASVGGGEADGGGFVFLRDTLREDVEVDDGKTVPILMDPPVTQFTCVSDIEDGDPFGMAAIARFGGGKEAWDHIWTGLFDAMHQALNRNLFLSGMSTLTREDINRRDGTPLDVMTKDDLPMYEEPPVLPDYVPNLLERLELNLNSAAGTNETSNGLDSTYSQSGIAKQIAIKTARVALAQYWQNTVKGLTHFWRLKTQLAQAKLTVPQMVKLSGVESAYKQPWFVGADMCGVREVALASGSGTMMTPSEKAQHLGFLQQMEWLDPEQAGELARASMTDDLGLPPSIHEEAVNREIAEWSKGPPPGWLDQQKQYDAQTAVLQQQLGAAVQQLVATGMDPQTAATTAQQQLQASGQAMPTPPALPFVDLANHQEQLVAIVRHRAFSRAMSTVEYAKQPLPWRAPFDQRYEAARKAAGIPTVAEQQAAAQAQVDAQAQAAGAHQDAKTQTEAAKLEDAKQQRQLEADEKEKDRVARMEEKARDSMSQEAIAQARAGVDKGGIKRPGRSPLPLRHPGAAAQPQPA